MGVLLAQHMLRNDQGLPKEGFSLLVFALILIEHGQVVEAESGVGVLLSQHALSNGQGLPKKGFRLLVLALGISDKMNLTQPC